MRQLSSELVAAPNFRYGGIIGHKIKFGSELFERAKQLHPGFVEV